MKKGTHFTEATRQKMRESARKRIMPPQTEEHKQKLRESNLKTWSNLELLKRHSKRTKEALANMSDEKRAKWMKNVRDASQRPENKKRARILLLKWRKNNPNWRMLAAVRRKGRATWMKGKHHTIQARIKNSITKKNSPLTPRGKNNPAYIDGKGFERRGDRLLFHQTLEYRLFREIVLKRDNYTCQECGEKGGRLHVDHIKSYRKYPELRTDINNGRTLCIECHIKTPNYGRKEDYAKTI